MALCWLIFAIFLCVMIAILLSSKKFHEAEMFKMHPQFEIEPHPSNRSLVSYNIHSTKSIRRIKSAVEIMLSPYKKTELHPWLADCRYGQQNLEYFDSCAVNLIDLGPCSAKNGYGYQHASPCFFLKLKRVENWKPSFFTLEELDISDLSGAYIESLKSELEDKNPSYLKTIWVECRGRHMIDEMYLGSVSYYPQRGFPYFYFPYKSDQLFYEEPIVAVQFKNPKSE